MKQVIVRPTLTMCCTGGIFVVGILEAGNKLIDPRLFSVIPESEEEERERREIAAARGEKVKEPGVRYSLSPPPGLPAFIVMGTDGFRYKIPETETLINDLYERVTKKTRATVEAPKKIM